MLQIPLLWRGGRRSLTGWSLSWGWWLMSSNISSSYSVLCLGEMMLIDSNLIIYATQSPYTGV